MSIFEEDWIMRQISDMTKSIGKMVLGRDISAYEIETQFQSKDSETLYHKLLELLDQHRYKEANEMLMEQMHATTMDYLRIVLNIYDRLNKLGDAELKEGDISRSEIYRSFDSITQEYGIFL